MMTPKVKFAANIISVLLLINAVASIMATTLTDLTAKYPVFGKWAGYSILVSAFLTPFLPRVQKILDSWGAVNTDAPVSDITSGAPKE